MLSTQCLRPFEIHAETTSTVIVFGSGSFERCLGHGGEALMNGTCALVQETPESSPLLPPCEVTEKKQLSRNWEAGPHQAPVCQRLDLELCGLQNCEREISVVYKPSGLYYFVILAQMAEYIQLYTEYVASLGLHGASKLNFTHTYQNGADPSINTT